MFFLMFVFFEQQIKSPCTGVVPVHLQPKLNSLKLKNGTAGTRTVESQPKTVYSETKTVYSRTKTINTGNSAGTQSYTKLTSRHQAETFRSIEKIKL